MSLAQTHSTVSTHAVEHEFRGVGPIFLSNSSTHPSLCTVTPTQYTACICPGPGLVLCLQVLAARTKGPVPSWTLFCDPVPTVTMNNAAWEGPTDAPQHVLTGRSGGGSTRRRK